MSALVTVKLVYGHRSNNAGEVCGFPPDEAAALLARKAAVPWPEQASVVEKSGEPAPAAPSPENESSEPQGELKPAGGPGRAPRGRR